MLEIILYEPEIPWNTGNIGRLCLANNIRLHLIEPLGFKIDAPNLKRAGVQYWDEVNVEVHANMQTAYEYLGAERNYYYLTTKTNRPYWDVEFQEDDVLVFGPESRGLPEDILEEHASQCLTIPMSNPEVRSLNLSTSVGIVMYQAIRQTI